MGECDVYAEYTEDLEALHLLHCGPVDVDRGVLPLLSPEVHNQLFVDVKERLLSLLVIRPFTVVLSALKSWCLVIELEVCLATQSWVNRDYRRG
jgi:hypothetical protein